MFSPTQRAAARQRGARIVLDLALAIDLQLADQFPQPVRFNEHRSAIGQPTRVSLGTGERVRLHFVQFGNFFFG